MPMMNEIGNEFPAAAQRLAPRLEALLEEVGRCALLIDLCADHAGLALAAVARGQAQRAVAIELREAPLVDARRALRASGCGERVLLLRGDGLDAISPVVRRPARAAPASRPASALHAGAPAESDETRRALVIAGVGGDLAAQLLARSTAAAGVERLVIQPNRHLEEVRAWAYAHGFHLRAERAVPEARRLHLLLSFMRADGPDPAYAGLPLELGFLLGPLFLRSSETCARAHLRREEKRYRALAARRPDLAAAHALLAAVVKRSWSPPRGGD